MLIHLSEVSCFFVQDIYSSVTVAVISRNEKRSLSGSYLPYIHSLSQILNFAHVVTFEVLASELLPRDVYT